MHTGNLHLAASQPWLPDGESTTITATVPLVSGAARLLTFAASGGMVSPTKTALETGLVTTTLADGPSTGMAIVTGATGPLNGSVFLRLLPGPVVTTTLTSTAWELAPDQSTRVSLSACDRFGNRLLDSTPIRWRTGGKRVTLARSSCHGVTGRATLIADLVPGEGTTTTTASLDTGGTATIAIDVHAHPCDLPATWRGDSSPDRTSHGRRTPLPVDSVDTESRRDEFPAAFSFRSTCQSQRSIRTIGR